jgi:hypothetical protein
MGEAWRDFFEVVGDQDHGRGGFVLREFTELVDEFLAAAQVQAGAGFIQQQQLRIRHEGAGNLDALALTFGQCSEGPVEQGPHSPGVQQTKGTAFVVALVAFAPPAGYAIGGGDHDVQDDLVLRDLGGECCGGKADPGAEFKNVNAAQGLIENPRSAAARMQPGGGDLEERGLAGAVGAKDDPAFAFVDLPVNLVQQGLLASDNADGSQFQNITHRSRH